MSRALDAQRPLPFKGGMRAALRRPAKTWRFHDGQRARVCPVCACNEGQRCVVRLESGDTGACVPAGVFGARVCSGCKQPSLFPSGSP